MGNSDSEGMDVVGNNTRESLWNSNHDWLVLCGPKVCQINIPHTITPPPAAAWAFGSRQVGSMDSGCWRQIRTLPSAASAKNLIRNTRLRYCSLRPSTAPAAAAELSRTRHVRLLFGPRGSTCCELRGASPLSTVIKKWLSEWLQPSCHPEVELVSYYQPGVSICRTVIC